MKRKDFLKGMGLAGAATLIPTTTAFSKLREDTNPPSVCTLIPAETAGPFPLDLTTNQFYFRQDVREDRAGVRLNMKMKIIGQDNCNPIANVRVNIWHCDKEGAYSGYSLPSNPGQAGLTYLRGYQITDVNGDVEFITILPGWYPGRVCHVHFRVYVSSNYAAISQLTFEPVVKNQIYNANPTIYTKGPDPLTIQQDGVFADGYAYQLATLTPNAATGGYDSNLEVTIKGSGVLATGYIERENEKYFTLGQNYPNPYEGQTTIPLTMRVQGDVVLDFYDLTGKKVASMTKPNLSAGEHKIPVSLNTLNIPPGNYVYQVNVMTDRGVMTAYKMMSYRL